MKYYTLSFFWMLVKLIIERQTMGLVYTEITLKNVTDAMKAKSGYIKEQDIRELSVEALADTGAWTHVINEEVREKLGLDILGIEPGTLANGAQELYNLAGPIEVRWKNRRTICEALVMPQAQNVLLGAIPLEGMDLTVNSREEKVVGIHGDEVSHFI
jgi:clan AA aspartic protease